jgi:hypothetical protein
LSSLETQFSIQEKLEKVGLKQVGKNRFLQIDENGVESFIGGMSKPELKTAFVLNMNVGEFFKRHPLENIGFLTLTFPRWVKTPREANKHFNQFNSHFLREISKEWIKVTEPHKDRRPHFHLLVAFPYDIRTGFDWETFVLAQKLYKENGKCPAEAAARKSYVLACQPKLRLLWSELRKACKLYGIGRSELLPIRKVGEAATRYVGKYIEKGSVHRTGEWAGARLTSYSQGFPRVARCSFSWVMASSFRIYASRASEWHGVPEDEMCQRFGSKWAYKLLLAQSNKLTAREAAAFLCESTEGYFKKYHKVT